VRERLERTRGIESKTSDGSKGGWREEIRMGVTVGCGVAAGGTFVVHREVPKKTEKKLGNVIDAGHMKKRPEGSIRG